MLEEIIKTQWLEKKPAVSLIYGIVVSMIAFFTSYILFYNSQNFIGISTLFFIVIISLPSILKILSFEEQTEAHDSKKSFLKEHESVIDIFIYFFLGVFIFFLVLTFVNSGYVFGQAELQNTANIIGNAISLDQLPTPTSNSVGGDSINNSVLDQETSRIITNNVIVLIVCFLLSLFYGGGALFLIVLNASIFAKALGVSVIQSLSLLSTTNNFPVIGFIMCKTGIMFIHMIPEIASYMTAAIAGGVLSKALVKEQWFSLKFNKVVKDSIILLLLSLVIIIVAGFFETKISKLLFSSSGCITNMSTILLIAGILVVLVLLLEFKRKELLFFKKMKNEYSILKDDLKQIQKSISHIRNKKK